MKVKICPLCDSEMKKAHYCDTCHSFIWRPEILDVHYNAQQRGMGEEDCAYGVSHDQKDHRNDIYGRFSDALKKEDKKQKNRKKATSHEEVYGSSIQKKAGRSYGTDRSGTDMEAKRRKAGGCLGKVVLAIIILNALLGVAGSHLIHYFTNGDFQYVIEDLMDELGVDDADEIIGSDTSSEEYYRELSEQEVSAYPDGCNGYGHFDVTDEDMGALIEAWTRTEYGRDISGDDSSSEDNYIYTYDGETTSYLQKTTYYNVDGEYNDYVIIYSDSATGKIHSVTASMEDTERIKSFLKMVVQKLDSKADWSGKELERQCDNFLKQMDSGDGGVDIDNMVINGSKYSDGEIWLSIDCTDF